MHRRERSGDVATTADGAVGRPADRPVRTIALAGGLRSLTRRAVAVLAVTLAVAVAVAAATPGGPAVAAPVPAPALAAMASPAASLPATADTTPGGDVAPPPGGTVTDFYPEQEDLSDCVGLVERPGCGSDARGGWRQGLVFAVVVVGLGLIAWRIAAAARRGRSS